MTRCLITGGTGFAGAWLARALLHRGDAVTVLARDEPPISPLELLGLRSEVGLVRGDVRDQLLVERSLAGHQIDTVFHLAAQTLVPTARQAPAETFATNLGGTWAVLEACRRQQVPRTVVASSDKAYGPSDSLPYREDQPLWPTFPYDVSKAGADLIARSYWHTYGLPVAVARFANVYGGGDINFSRLVPEAACAALDGRAPVIRSDGSPRRDFLYAEDAAHAYVAVAGTLDGRAPGAGEAFNASGGPPREVREVVDAICEIAGTGTRPEIRGDGIPPGELGDQHVDAAKLRERTGWQPRVQLHPGLEQTVAWYADHPRVRPDRGS